MRAHFGRDGLEKFPRINVERVDDAGGADCDVEMASGFVEEDHVRHSAQLDLCWTSWSNGNTPTVLSPRLEVNKVVRTVDDVQRIVCRVGDEHVESVCARRAAP